HLGRCEVGAECGEQAGCRESTHRELAGTIQKAAAVDVAVHVGVKQDQQFLIKISGCESVHASPLQKMQDRPETATRPQGKRPVRVWICNWSGPASEAPEPHCTE